MYIYDNNIYIYDNNISKYNYTYIIIHILIYSYINNDYL